jgi:hypothetical protein
LIRESWLHEEKWVGWWGKEEDNLRWVKRTPLRKLRIDLAIDGVD